MSRGPLGDWIQDRTGLFDAIRRFMTDHVPSSVGWRNTLGSVAGALISLQLLTGFLLALYYVPHPEAAYVSIEHIEENLSGGALIRALHYWGASFIVAALFIHMVRVFYSGAYKRPRETTWAIGVVIFLLVMAFVGTGQLLPWNQAGYWAAKVGVELASSSPVIGPYIRDIILGGKTLGAITLTRFYAVHVVLFPAILGLLIVFHLYLLRRHGALRAHGDPSTDTIPFFPYQVLRDFISISVILLGLLFFALHFGGPESPPADPGDSTYIPHPEWYFLSHFEILRFTPGPLKILTTFYLPAVGVLILLALPWLDRGKSHAIRHRPFISAFGTLAIVMVVSLTTYGVVTGPERRAKVQEVEAEDTEDSYDIVKAGRRFYMKSKCQECHRINRRGGHIGPDLSGVGARLKRDYMRQWLINPVALNPDAQMPPTQAAPRELDELMAFLMSLVGEANP